MKVSGVLISAAAMVAATVGEANAATVTSYFPSTIVSALQDAGYKAKLSVDAGSDPNIVTAANGVKILILFSGCQNHASCDQVEFVSYWTCEKEQKKCQDEGVKWNGEEQFSHTFMVKNDLYMYRHMLFERDGVSSTLFIKNFEYFSRDAMNIWGRL